MQNIAYVFVNDKGWFFGDRESADIRLGKRITCFYKPFQEARLFSSIKVAKIFRDGIINTDISDKMILMPIDLTHTKQDIFKAILKKD